MNAGLVAQTEVLPDITWYVVSATHQASRSDISEPGTVAPPPALERASATATATNIKVEFLPTSQESSVLVVKPDTGEVTVASSAAQGRWTKLKQSHWPSEGREERVAAALAALDSAIVDCGLSLETIRALVEDVDLEDL